MHTHMRARAHTHSKTGLFQFLCFQSEPQLLLYLVWWSKYSWMNVRMSSEVSESSAVLPFLVAGVFPFSFIIGYGNTEIHPRKSPEFWTWFCSRNTIGSWLSESIIPAVKWSPLPVGSGTRGPKMTRWQSPSPVHWNHCCALKRNHSSLQTSTDHYCTDGRQNCCKKVIQFDSERSHSHSNSWCLGSCVLAVDERAPNVGYWPEHILSCNRTLYFLDIVF